MAPGHRHVCGVWSVQKPSHHRCTPGGGTMSHRILCLALASSLLAIVAAPPPPPRSAEKVAVGKLQRKTFDKDGKTKLEYLLYLPQGYDKDDKKVPLVLFLH